MCNLYDPKPDYTGGKGKGKRRIFRLAHHPFERLKLHAE